MADKEETNGAGAPFLRCIIDFSHFYCVHVHFVYIYVTCLKMWLLFIDIDFTFHINRRQKNFTKKLYDPHSILSLSLSLSPVSTKLHSFTSENVRYERPTSAVSIYNI